MKELDLCVIVSSDEKSEIVSKAIVYKENGIVQIYDKGDIVFTGDNYYISTENNNGESPFSSSKWKKIIFQG